MVSVQGRFDERDTWQSCRDCTEITGIVRTTRTMIRGETSYPRDRIVTTYDYQWYSLRELYQWKYIYSFGVASGFSACSSEGNRPGLSVGKWRRIFRDGDVALRRQVSEEYAAKQTTRHPWNRHSFVYPVR